MSEKKQISVGGQAVIEGVMMRGPEHLATAIRRADKSIELKKEPFVSKTQTVKWMGVPIIRGFVSLIEMMIIGFKTLSFSAERYELDLKEEEKKKNENYKEKSKARNQAESFVSYVIAFGLAILLFGIIPYKASHLVHLDKNNFYFNLFAGLIRIIFFVLYVWLISKLKDVFRVFQYHGAEHKNVNAYEHNAELIPSKIQAFTTLHPRCGTSFMVFVLLIAILFFSIVDTLVAVFILHSTPHWSLRLAYHILLIPVVSGISYEVLKLSGKNINHPLVKLMVVPGMALQRITTQQPDDEMVEVGLIAMKAALDMDISEYTNVTDLSGTETQ
ncbi:MAG TPA: DUF1385 domain-containing protein [Candidatus Cloacimonadota bacterium]|nr:DUF1385 domain-containing protein [Candidatus Cloacimonadota bacterium]HPT71404.1 DUF1385 domain-containing protein [Candidatus Cloacimonadota bacterium]